MLLRDLIQMHTSGLGRLLKIRHLLLGLKCDNGKVSDQRWVSKIRQKEGIWKGKKVGDE